MERLAHAEFAVEARKVTRRFGSVTALDGVSLQVKPGEFFSLLGPSGCGKTTLLRLVAGLDFADAGSLAVLGRDAVAWPAHQRPVNTVFQSYALFPHLTVLQNIQFGLQMKKVPSPELSERAQRVMDMVQISDLAQRKPSEISGGQKQRVALARAVINEPKILLLDEPLGALDLKLRKQLQLELHQLQRRLGITFIYVTHDQEEALTMSDRIAVMNEGRIVQLDSPREIYERPQTRFVAQFLGACNLISGCIKSSSGNASVIAASCGDLMVKTSRASGLPITLAIRPEKLILRKEAGSIANQIQVTVEDLIYSGAETQYRLRSGELSLKCAVFNVPGHGQFSIGDRAYVELPPEALVVLNDSL